MNIKKLSSIIMRKFKNLVAMGLVLAMVGNICGLSASSYYKSLSNTSVENNISTIVTDDGVYIEGAYYTKAKFTEILDTAIVDEPHEDSRVAGLLAGTWLIPGVGEVVITVAGVIIVAGAVVKVGSWIYNTVSKLFAQKAIIQSVKKKIPNSLKKPNGDVDLGKFKDKNGRTPLDKKYGEFKNGRWTVEKDISNHGGNRAWKLKDGGSRVGTLDKDGEVVGD